MTAAPPLPPPPSPRLRRRENAQHQRSSARADQSHSSLLPPGWADEHDAAVYDAARRLFAARAREYAPCAAPRACREALAAFLREEEAAPQKGNLPNGWGQR